MTLRTMGPALLGTAAGLALGMLWPQAGVRPPAPPPAAPAADAASARPGRPALPLIALADDGTVTLHVEQQPLDWVLAQIEAQGGGLGDRPGDRPSAAAPPARASAVAAEAADSAACAPRPGVDAAALRQALARGTDGQRHDALLQAREQGLVLGADELRIRRESDASPGVQLLALQAEIERASGDAAALRALLEAATRSPQPAVRAAAQQHLDELDERERVDAANPQPGAPPG